MKITDERKKWGQCFISSVLTQKTVELAMPSRPLLPSIPGKPFSPRGPGCPDGPRGPSAPSGPGSPGNPTPPGKRSLMVKRTVFENARNKFYVTKKEVCLTSRSRVSRNFGTFLGNLFQRKEDEADRERREM